MTDRSAHALAAVADDSGASLDETVSEALAARSFETLVAEIGRLASELHDAAADLPPDESQLSQTQRLIVDARERLAHFIRKSAQASDGALAAVETMIPLSHQLVEQAEAMRALLDAGAEGAALAEQARQFTDNVEHGARKLRTGLSDVLVAQEYQDLAGEVLGRAVDLADEAEARLRALLQACRCTL